MNTEKKSNTYLSILKDIDRNWLLHKPWLWETRIHYVLAYTISLNIAIFILSLFGQSSELFTVIAAIFSLLGFGFWIYQLWQFSIEQDRGKVGAHISQKRFGIYGLSVFLFILPTITPSLLDYYHAEDLIFSLGSAGFFSAMGAILIQVWKQIHTKLFIYTVVTNLLGIVGLSLLISLSSFFVILLVAMLIFGFPMLISLISDVPQIRKFSNWKVIALASIQFYAPFLLTFVIGLFMIPFAEVFSGAFFILGLGIAAFSYIAYVLPTFRKMHIHLQALPR